MKRLVARLFFALSPWRIIGDIPDVSRNYVLIVTPHTSNQDYWMGLLAFWRIGAKPVVLIKQEAFKGVQGWLLRNLGAVPVNRQGDTRGLILRLRKRLEKRSGQLIVITPEGTRQRSGNWKTGFYLLARACRVPILMGWMDYARKTVSYGIEYTPTGDQEQDFAAIRTYYASVTPVGKVPEWGHQELWPEVSTRSSSSASSLS